MFTWSGCSLIVIDTTVVLDQLLSRVQGSSLFRGYPLWVAMFLLLVIVGNFVLKVKMSQYVFIIFVMRVYMHACARDVVPCTVVFWFV